MEEVKVYGSFVKRGEYIYRTSSYIQWGDSEKSIGACLLLNPGLAQLEDGLRKLVDEHGSAKGLITSPDPTMRQLIAFVEAVHGINGPIRGRLYIYNLFNLQNPRAVHAVELFESLVQSGEYDVSESLVPLKELKLHPWILLGWGVRREARWKNLALIKEKWRDLIRKAEIPVMGKMHKEREDYYHPCPLIPTQRPIILNELVSIYKEKIG